ncbi:MAG: hypothetical protein ACON4U_06095 [Myxococcota bacterium]
MSTASGELQSVGWRRLMLVFALGFAFFVIRRQLTESTWVPMGADWDSWLQGAVSLRFGGSYPMVRWPLFGFCVAVVDFLLPTPLHISAQLLSMASVAGSAAGLFWILGRLFSNNFWAWVGWFFCLTFPLNMSFAEWCSSYALWGCACVWTVVSLFEYHHSRQLKWAFGMGVGTAFSLAIMAKGLALGAFFGVFSIALLLLSGRRFGLNFASFVLPLVIAYLSYAHFDHELKSLDAHIASVDFARNRPLKAGHIYDPTEDPHAYASKGYVFGQSMSPKTVLDALQFSAQSVEPEQRQRNYQRSTQIIQTAFPSLSRVFLVYLCLSFVGLMVFCRRGWVCWLSASAILLSSVPSLFVEFNMRFLIPSTAVGALLVIAPIAAIASAIPKFGSLVGASMALGVWFTTPSSDHEATFNWLDALLVKGKQGIWIESQLPKGTVHVIAPPSIGVPVAGARGGHLIVPGSSQLDQPFAIPESDLVLMWVDFPDWAKEGEIFTISPMMPPFPEGLTQLEGRKVLKRHPLFQSGAGVVVLGALIDSQ